MPSDDLSDLIVPHWTQGAPATPRLGGPPGKPASYVQGVIVSWKPDKLEDVVRFDGAELHNLPVLAGPDALTFRPGDIVGVQYWAPEGGSGQYWILPRIVVPGSGAAAAAIASLRTDLGRQVARGVFGEAIHVDTVDGSASISDQDAGNDWIDLPGSPGPTVSDVEISESGRAWVFMTARLSVETHSTDAQIVMGAMSYVVSGQTSRQPNLAHALELSNITQITSGGPVTSVVSATMTRVHTVIGLAPGVHTFTAKYTAAVSGTAARATFSRRELQVIPF